MEDSTKEEKRKLLEEEEQTEGEEEEEEEEEEDDEEKEGEKPPAVPPPIENHPLQSSDFSHVILNVLSWLDVQSLKNARHVCKKWRVEGAKILQGKTALHFNKFGFAGSKTMEKEEKVAAIRRFLALEGPVNLALVLKDSSLRDVLKVLQEVPELGRRTYALTCGTPSVLPEYFPFLRNLKILNTNFESLDLSGKLWNECCNFDGDNSEPHNRFLASLETLQEIKVPIDLKALEEYGNYRRQKRIQNLFKEIRTCDRNHQQLVMEFFMKLKYDWPIVKFSCEVSLDYDPGVIRQVLASVSGTLKHLTLDLSTTSFDDSKYLENWVLPVDQLNSLETLCLLDDPKKMYLKNDRAICRSLVDALQLPKLKVLRLTSFPWGLDDLLQKWRDHPFKKSKSDSIQEIEIRETGRGRKAPLSKKFPQESSLLFFTHCSYFLPNLRSLKVVAKMDSNIAKIPWSQLRNLERLSLDLEFDHRSQFDLVESWIVGMRRPLQYRNGQIFEEDKSIDFDYQQLVNPVPSLRDLKNLKSLELFLDNATRDHEPPSDFMVYNCLRSMSNLQSLCLWKVNHSSKVEEDLRAALGPTAAINILNDREPEGVMGSLMIFSIYALVMFLFMLGGSTLVFVGYLIFSFITSNLAGN